jgi:hypothetical protein
VYAEKALTSKAEAHLSIRRAESLRRRSAIKTLIDLDSTSYVSLPCLEVRKQFFSEVLKEAK